MAAFIITILLFSIFDVTIGCLPKPDIVEDQLNLNEKYKDAVNSIGRLTESFHSFEDSVRKILNASKIIDETNNKTENDTVYNITDTVVIEGTNGTVQKDESRIRKVSKKCYVTKECNELWKRFFSKCGCH